MLLISGENFDILLKKGGPKQNLGYKDPQSEWRKSCALNEMKGSKNLGYKIHRSGKP